MERKIDLIVVHCSDSDRSQHDNVTTIAGWHKERGFTDIGYHYVITKDGVIHEGRELNEVGAHVKGHNRNSIGICLTGRIRFSQAQFDSLAQLIHTLVKRYGLDYKDVLHHRDLDKNKTCPNFSINEALGGKND